MVRFTVASVLLGFLATLKAVHADLTVATPVGVTQCQPTLISWTVTAGTSGPFSASVIPGGQASAAPLENFPTTSDTSFTWTVDIPAGTSITIQVRDAAGQLHYSAPVTILAGSTTSCSSGVSSPPAGGGTTTPATVGISTPPGTSVATVPVVSQVTSSSVTSVVAPASNTASARPTSAVPSSSAGSAPGAANAVRVPAFGLIGLLGAAALLA